MTLDEAKQFLTTELAEKDTATLLTSLLNNFGISHPNFAGITFREAIQKNIVLTTEGLIGENEKQEIRVPENIFDFPLDFVLHLLAHEFVHIEQRARLNYYATREEREFEATRQGDEIHLIADGFTAVCHLLHYDEHTALLEWVQPDGTRQHIRLAGLKSGDNRQLWVNGRTFTASRIRERGHGRQANSSLAAAIPAVVTEILVNVGDSVAEGDRLILLESMKMVIPIQAPYAGVVTAVHCQPGDSVQAGIQLIELETIGD
ncbi:MAG: hypothetical protein HC804_14755 [Anaerolineae bacterium]|nr:hypothetical protein [Anaerolineae bacterium]